MNTSERNWKYYLLEKKYPSWIYVIVLAIWGIIIYLWVNSAAGI